MIKLAILDVDGVMTDGTKYYDRDGNVVQKTFCDKDWTAIKRLRAVGVEVLVITGDPYNKKILENRNIPVIVNRENGEHRDKSEYLPQILKDYNCTSKEVLYIGDDLFDIGIMRSVGHPFCPVNSPRLVRQSARILQGRGGDNLIVELFDYLEINGLIPIVQYEQVIAKINELDLKEKF
jgi:YrbI family 3-deoxy-D-manno-octulosonate 8-phosphate phosphatase